MKKIADKEVNQLLKKLKKVMVDMEYLSRKNHLKYRLTMENRLGELEHITMFLPTSPSRSWKDAWFSQLKNKMRDKDISTRILESIA